MSFTGLQNTFIPLSINGLTNNFSSDTNAGNLTATSIVIDGTKNPLLSFPVSQDNITQFNSKYILQYSPDFGTTTTDIFNATNTKLTVQVPLSLYQGLDLSGNLTVPKMIIKNSTSEYSMENDSKDRLVVSYNSNPYFYFKNDGKFESVSLSSNTIEATVSLTSPIITSNQLNKTTAGDLLIENSGGNNLALNVTGVSSSIYLESGVGTQFTNSGATVLYGSITPSGFSMPNPSVYAIAFVQYISGSQLVVVVTPTLDPYTVGDVLNIEDNFYRGQVVYQSNASSSSFYVSNPGYGNSGNKFGGSISLNKGIINSNITRNKQNIIDSLYTFKKNPTTSSLQLLYVNDDTLYSWSTAGRFFSFENECKTVYCSDAQITGSVSYINGSHNWASYSTSGGNLNFDYNSVNKVFIDTGGKLTCTSLGFINSLSTASVTLSSAEVSTLTGIDTTQTIQAQINALSGSGFLTKTGTNTGVNCRFTLSSGGIFDVYSGSGILFSIGQTTGKTFIFDLSSTSQINSISASYFDVSSSIQNQIDSKIAKNGVTNIVIPVLRFTSAGNYFQVQDDSSNELVSFAKTYNTFTQETYYTCNSAILNSQIRIAYGTGKTILFHNNGTDFYILVSDTLSGSYNLLRPFFINMTSGLLQSNNSQTFQGITNLQNIQFSDITTVPNGLTTEVGELINWQINFRNTADRTVVTATQGIFFRLDNRSSVPPFQWYFRAAGSLVETQIMDLASNGDLTIGRRFKCQSATAGINPLIVQTHTSVGVNNGMTIGPQISDRNCVMMDFNFVSSSSSNNYFGMGLYFFEDRFKLYSNKAVFEDEVTVPSIKVGSGTITTNVNPYVLVRTDTYNAMEYGENMSGVIQEIANWGGGAVYPDWFRKYTANSCVTFNGTVTCYSNTIGLYYFRITFQNATNSYTFDYGFYFNVVYSHTTIGFCGVLSDTGNIGLGTFGTAGLYTVTFQKISAQILTDANDSINMTLVTTSNWLGL